VAARSPDPYVAMDSQPDPLVFARLLELRGAQPHQRRLRRAFLTFAGIRPGWQVLDVGCGTGVVTRDIRARVGRRGRVVGVDATLYAMGGLNANGSSASAFEFAFIGGGPPPGLGPEWILLAALGAAVVAPLVLLPIWRRRRKSLPRP